MAITNEERAERLWNAFIQAEYDWSNTPRDTKLKNAAKKKYAAYVGFCMNNGINFKKVNPF